MEYASKIGLTATSVLPSIVTAMSGSKPAMHVANKCIEYFSSGAAGGLLFGAAAQWYYRPIKGREVQALEIILACLSLANLGIERGFLKSYKLNAAIAGLYTGIRVTAWVISKKDDSPDK